MIECGHGGLALRFVLLLMDRRDAFTDHCGGNMKNVQILVTEPDPVISSSISTLLQAREFSVQLFSNAQAMIGYLMRFPTADFEHRCVLMNTDQNDFSGYQTLKNLQKLEPCLRVILYSDSATTETVINAWRNGAAMFLLYPFAMKDLSLVIDNCLKVNREMGRPDEREVNEIRGLFEALTRREREVLVLVANGYRNQQIAQNLQISLPTVKMHRGNLMRKLGLKSVVQAVDFHQRCQRASLTISPNPIQERF